MTDWLTIQWPPRRDRGNEPPEGFDDEPNGLWIQREHGPVADLVRAGDRVFVYETRTGPALRQDGRVYSCVRGRQGVIAVGHVGRVRQQTVDLQEYATGTRSVRRWSFRAPFKNGLDMEGFVPRRKLNHLLGYKARYLFRGFGLDRSGTGRLSPESASGIQREFDTNRRRERVF